MKKTKFFKKLPGSNRMRNIARKRKCHKITKDTWLVWGGEREHTIKQDGQSLECDCDNFKRNNICAHSIRVQMEMGIFPERKRYPGVL